jgi:hypothetical protein
LAEVGVVHAVVAALATVIRFAVRTAGGNVEVVESAVRATHFATERLAIRTADVFGVVGVPLAVRAALTTAVP